MTNDNPVRTWVRAHEKELIDLLTGLIAIDSVSGREGPIAEYCERWLKAHRIEPILQPCKGRYNVIGVTGEGEDALVIAGHLDTVPPNEGAWTNAPLEPTVRDGRVYGLGASDMCASIASAYMASVFLARQKLPGRYVTAMTIEEEVTGDGTRGFLEWALDDGFLDPKSTVAVVTEPTSLSHVCLGNRGVCFLEIRVEGKGGHGSRPQSARNPIVKLREILVGLADLERRWAEEYPDADLGITSLTPTAIRTGALDKMNVIPQVAEAAIDCRPVTALFANGLERFRSGLNACLQRFEEPGYDIVWREHNVREGHRIDARHPIVGTLMGVMRDDVGLTGTDLIYNPAGNDAVFYGLAGIPTINKVGPGLPETSHGVDEYVPIENVLLATEVFIWLALRHFGAALR